MKVPLSVGWLSENDLLTAAGKLLGYTFSTPSEIGIQAKFVDGVPESVVWSDSLLFTTTQLAELGFE
jgi:hypothetical protein